MLRKLLKYEVKATSMIFIFMYIAIIGLAIFNKIFNSFEFEWGIVATAGVLVALFMALGVITVIMAVQRFNKNLLGDEGYLMFTLPVDNKKIIISKLLVTIMWTFFSGIVALLTFMILCSTYIDWYTIKEAVEQIQVHWRELDAELRINTQMSIWGFMICMAIAIIVSYTEFILMIYGSLTIAQLPIFSKHRGLSAFGAFFVFNIIINNILTTIIFGIVDINTLSPKMVMIGGIIFSVIISIGLFVGINIILNKHLNLE